MTKPTLTEDQRWLLRMVGGWTMRDCLIGSAGVTRLMQSCCGGTRVPADRYPAHIKGFECGRGTIVSRGIPVVTVTTAQLNKYARSLPADLVAEMRECATAAQRTNILRSRFWHCGSDPCGFAYMGDRICPPTEQQEADASAEYWRCHDWTEDLLDRALRIRHRGRAGRTARAVRSRRMIAPYYQDDLVTLFHGDCLAITDWLRADVLVTDPPYGTQFSEANPNGGYGRRQNAGLGPQGFTIANDATTETRDAALAYGASDPRCASGVHVFLIRLAAG